SGRLGGRPGARGRCRRWRNPFQRYARGPDKEQKEPDRPISCGGNARCRYLFVTLPLMSDIIQLLPDAVANQIAAGEVVQRPATAVKELIENAIDAGADKIRLIIKDGGKSLIQLIDNGCGMSITDARLCFERHATSKIRKADDLFAIRTMGFRGEALASIAAIAHVELKTRRVEDELGTRIEIAGSELVRQEPESLPAGTSICIKNLFY